MGLNAKSHMTFVVLFAKVIGLLVLRLSLPILQYRLQADQAVLAVELEVDVTVLDLEYCGSHPVCGADDCPD